MGAFMSTEAPAASASAEKSGRNSGTEASSTATSDASSPFRAMAFTVALCHISTGPA